MAATILQLSQLIANSASQLVSICSAQGLEIPELNDASASESGEMFRKNPIAAVAVNNIAAAAFQLIACVLPPQDYALQMAFGHYKSSALRVAVGCHVPEVLHEAGEQGLHVDEIAAKTGVDSVNLAHLLRTLANCHIFREIKEDVFTNNRISGTLDTRKPLQQILNDPNAKHDDTHGRTAFIEFITDEGHKASAYILESMQDLVTARQQEPHHTAFARGHGTNKGFYEWYADPSQDYRRRRFATSMRSWAPDSLLESFDWNALPNDALVVDVGGGIGSFTKVILSAYPKLKFVVQDIPSVIEDGIEFWNGMDSEAIQSGRVSLQAHDFFTPQPVTNASVFIIKHVLHNWSHPHIIKMLTHLRNAATPSTVLLIFDAVLRPSAKTESEIEIDRLSEQGFDPPDILSTGYTSINDKVWMVNTHVLACFNTQQHTMHQLDQLLRSAGWKIVKVVLSGGFLDNVQAKPI